MTLKIADPRLAMWLCSNPMRSNGEMIAIVTTTPTMTLVLPWPVHPDAWRRE